MRQRPLAVVTGASTGIGLAFARLCASRGFDLILTADEPEIFKAANEVKSPDTRVWEMETDLATMSGVDTLCAFIERLSRPVDILIANAGRGLGGAFLDQDFSQVRRVLDTNIMGTVYLTHRVGRAMRARGNGRILIVGSIAGFIPGSFQAVYHGAKAFLYNFSIALGDELRESGVTVTCLMPGVTDTEFFRRAGMLDTEAGRSRTKSDPAEVAKDGLEALMEGRREVVSGWRNKMLALVAHVTPASILAWQNRRLSAPEQPR